MNPFPRLATLRLVAVLLSFPLVASACSPGPGTSAPGPALGVGPTPDPPCCPGPASNPTVPPQPKAGAGQARQGGTLRISTLGGAPKVLHLYPEAQQYTTPHSDAMSLIATSLIDVDYEKLDFVADPRRSLAKEMPKVSNDGRTFTFTLRDDARWSDGKPITSADFQFAWEHASKKENNFVGLADLERIESFKTPDPKTVEVTLKEQLARFLALDIARRIIPVPKHVWDGKPWLDPAGNPEILKPTVVSGPYLPKELTVERHGYARNPNWWGKVPHLDEIVFVTATPQTTLELLKTRQVEWAQNFPPTQYDDARQQAHLNVFEWSAATGTYRVMQFNLKRPYLADQKVREALVRAINREDLVEFENNLAVPQLGFYTAGSKWRTDDVEPYAFDLNRSKQLLQEAGYRLEGGALKGPDDQPLKIDILWPSTSQPRGKMATYIQQQWKQLGVEAQVTGLEFNAFTDKYQRQRDFDVVMGSFAAQPDPDSMKSQILTGGTQNASGYSNPRVDDLLKQGAAEQDEARRKQIYDEIQKIVVAELPQFYLLSLKEFTAFDKKIGGVAPTRGGDLLRQNNLQVLDWHITQ